MSAPNLSLYNIRTELLELLRYREEIASDPDMTPQEMQTSLEICDDRIREYVTGEIAKVDGIAAYFRECDARQEALRAEAKRILAQADIWEQRGKRLNQITLRVMQQTGATHLEGATSTFKVRKNPPSLDVAQPELVPAPYQRRQVTLTTALWDRLLAHLFATPKGATLFVELQECKISEPEAMKDAIKKELKAGVGVPGCRMREDSVRLVVE